jgi:hypothetical protein
MSNVDPIMKGMEYCRQSQERGVPGEYLHFMTSGHPGVGKNHRWQQYAGSINYQLYVIILGNEDNLDMAGMWVPDFEKDRLKHLMTERFMGDDIPEEYDGRIVLFDEVGNAPHMQTTILSIIEDRMHNNKPVGDNVIFGFATNLADSGCGAARINNALQARIWNEVIEPDTDEWIEWGIDHNIHGSILGWLQYSPVSLHSFDAKSKEFGQCNPRAWHKLSGMMNNGVDEDKEMLRKASVAMLGSIEGMKFIGWCQLDEDLPSMTDIIDHASECLVPDESHVSSQYAIISNIVSYFMNEESSPPEYKVAALTYLRRLKEPLAAYGFKILNRRCPKFGEDNPAAAQFVVDYSKWDL